MATGAKPQVIGAGFYVHDTTELAALGTNGITPGTRAYVGATDAFYTYKITDTPDVAAAGIAGAGWVADAAAGTAWNVVTLGSDGAALTVSGLTGETDGGYEGYLYAEPATGGGGSITCRPNNLTTNQESAEITMVVDGGGAHAPAGATEAILRVGSCADGSPIVPCFAHFVISSKTGRERSWECGAYNKFVSGVLAATSFTIRGQWKDSATAITSLVFVCTGNMKGTNSFVAWRALKRGF